MIAKNLISDGIMPLKTSDTGKTALSWMEEYKVSHLPIVNNQEFLGLISELDIYDLNNFDEPLGNHKLSLNNPYVFESQHIYDVLKLINEQNLSLVPVLSEKGTYLGSISLQSLVKHFARALSVDNPGSIIVLEMSYNNYSLTEISKIVEENDAKILSTFLFNHEDSTRLDVFLKLNTVEIASIVKTFERYDYFVKASYGHEEDLDDLRERYNSLMNYLNV
ncbi:CBS domain-containing protein [Candidatus Sulfidibacterium hydrothermale]|uniref:CBS domain-containing protein n=1 Tax=Candidatus Sulfidibacterium hydrothermale TaxID=2875962 RepID=UPI001F0AB164|nr:CBS domain-containing protein [Candidatus Sulfidibacterium hydrothermale]UBM63220.1 CBS domain-containing protein [Candidatus Sulfidibacterium hydrothermale]